MPFKNLEHDGNEDFLNDVVKARTVVAEEVLEQKEVEDSGLEEKLIEKQQKWLDPRNPFLWEGDLDEEDLSYYNYRDFL